MRQGGRVTAAEICAERPRAGRIGILHKKGVRSCDRPPGGAADVRGGMARQGPIVEVEDVTKDYALGKVRVHALSGVTLTIGRGDFAAIAGPSGSGKTTLLNLIGCVDVPTRGTVRIEGHDTSALSERALTELRLRKLGFIFQSFNLIPVLSLFQNVELPLLLRGELSRQERGARVDEILHRVGLDTHARHRPSELSGGQRQRVAIARALVGKPRIVLADEPTANLDSKTGAAIIELMRELNHEDETTFVFSTHDRRVMDRADRLILLEDGRLVGERGPAEAGHLEAR